jgi:dienelactone hydrolase
MKTSMRCGIHRQPRRSHAWHLFWMLPVGLLMLSTLRGYAQDKSNLPADIRASITRHLDMPYSMPFYRSADEWSVRKEALRKQILVAAGLWPTPDKKPLNAQLFGRMERKGYTIEKVYFESYPGFYVTGNLYRPTGKSGISPGILAPHGHWNYGRLEHNELCSVPARCINLARQGNIVFSYDMVGYNDSRQMDHRFNKVREALWGFGSLGLHLWNSIRSLDFLESLTDVDKTRLACTGASGGGTQTFLLAAVDPRIKAAAPVNMISAHMQGGDVCENAPNLRIDTNNMEIAALIAPRPLILVSATGDWTKNTLEIEFPAIQRIYRLLQAEDKITAVRVQANHNYNRESREHVYRWFGQWLLGEANPDLLSEKDATPERPADLLVFYGRPLPEGAKSEEQIAQAFIHDAQLMIDRLKPASSEDWERYRQAFEPALRYSLMAEFPQPVNVSAFMVQPLQQPEFRVVRFFMTRAGMGDRVPATLWLPGGKIAVRQAILLTHPKGSEVFEEAGRPGKLVAVLLQEGNTVLIPDLFNTGKTSFQRSEDKKFFTTYNRTDDANRVQDILTSLAYLRAQAGLLPLKVVGFEKAGIWCLLARALANDDAAFAVNLDQFAADSDAAFLRDLNIPGIRRAGDFRTAAVLNLRAPLWIHNASETFPSDWLQSVFSALGRSGLLRIDNRLAGEQELMEWLLRDLRKKKP